MSYAGKHVKPPRIRTMWSLVEQAFHNDLGDCLPGIAPSPHGGRHARWSR